jgi:hypothetical protein
VYVGLPDEQKEVWFLLNGFSELGEGNVYGKHKEGTQWKLQVGLRQTYPSFLHHITNFLHGGILIVACKVIQNAKGCYLPTSAIFIITPISG